MMTIMHKTRRRSGFTLVEIMVVVMVIGVILAIAIPSWIGARTRSYTRTCVSQLRKIQYAKESWAMDNKKDQGDVPAFDDLVPTYLKSVPSCPAGGDYSPMAISTDPICSIGAPHVLTN